MLTYFFDHDTYRIGNSSFPSDAIIFPSVHGKMDLTIYY